MKRFPFGQLLAISALTFMAGLTYTSVFRWGDLGLLLVAAVGIPMLTSVALRSWPRPNLLIVVLTHATLYVVFMTLLVFPETAAGRIAPTGSTFAAMGDGIRNGWAVILSSTIPAPARPGALFVPVTLTWISMLVGTELLFRTRRVFPTLLPAILLGCSGILFSGGASGTFALGSIAFVAVAAGLISTRAASFASDPRAFDDREFELAQDPSQDQEFRSSLNGTLIRQRLAMTALFIIVVVLVAVPLAGRLPFVDPNHQTLLRDHYDVPVEDRRRISPLAEVAAGVGDETVRYRLVVDQAITGKPTLRAAVLDQYDGVTWSSKGSFMTTGSRLPNGPPMTESVKRVRQQVTVVDAASPWLPMLSDPVELEVAPAVGAQVDRSTNAVYVPGGPQAGLVYSAQSDVSAVTPEQLQGAGVASDDAARAVTGSVPDIPPEVAELQKQILGNASSPFQQLARILGFFRNNPAVNSGKAFELNSDAAPNFTIGGLTTFLTGKNGRTGRPEQFAAAFATLARSAGFPVRIVVGYRLPDEVPAGTTTEIHAQDLSAWPEVALAGLGWVALDPTPSDKSSSQLTVEEQQLDAVVNSAVDQAGQQTSPPTPENPNLRKDDDPHENDTSHLKLVLLLVLVGGVIATVLVRPWFRKRSRRARRRAEPDLARRTAGAWQEAMDRLVESGVPNPRTLTTRRATEVAAENFGTDAADALAALGPLVNVALHDRRPIGPELSDEAWQHEMEFERAMRASRTRRARLRALFDRRPLVVSDEQ